MHSSCSMTRYRSPVAPWGENTTQLAWQAAWIISVLVLQALCWLSDRLHVNLIDNDRRYLKEGKDWDTCVYLANVIS